jgi:hypothetical protein
MSPIESAISTAEPITHNVDVPSSKPDVYAREQGMSFETAQDLFVTQMVANQDPMAAASTLLQFASASASSSETTRAPPTTSVVERPPAPGFSSMQARPAYNFFQQPELLTAPARAPTHGPTIPAPNSAFRSLPGPLRRMPTLNKQDILAKARERRRQLVGEIDRAKVELWETTIEQGVLAQLVKEKL